MVGGCSRAWPGWCGRTWSLAFNLCASIDCLFGARDRHQERQRSSEGSTNRPFIRIVSARYGALVVYMNT